MTTFNDRERGFEGKFAHDQETQFKIMGRRNRLLGEWAGALLGHSGEALTDYARSVVRADFEEAGDEDVVRKVTADLAGKASEAEVRAKLNALLPEAEAQVQAGG
jgi:hypothetical protein